MSRSQISKAMDVGKASDQVEVLEGLIEVIQGGPVASVAGKSGVVTFILLLGAERRPPAVEIPAL